MKSVLAVQLKKNEVDALRELRSILTNKFDGVDLILYGSKARGDFSEFSDLDVLVLTGTEVNNDLEEKIFNFSFKIELKHDVIFGIVVYSKVFWNSILGNSMPLHWNIDKEGIDLESILNEYWSYGDFIEFEKDKVDSWLKEAENLVAAIDEVIERLVNPQRIT